MFLSVWSTVRAFLRDAAGSLYHILIVAMSAGIALLLPAGAKQFLSFWSRVEHDKLSLIAVEMTVAILLIVCLNYVHRSRRDRALATVATGAGLVSFFPRRTRGRSSISNNSKTSRARAGPSRSSGPAATAPLWIKWAACRRCSTNAWEPESCW